MVESVVDSVIIAVRTTVPLSQIPLNA